MNNPPAFPRISSWRPADGHPEPWDYGDPGMSLRDWFAGLAMQALLTHEQQPGTEAIAHNAYYVADSMLIERERTAKEAAK